MVVSRFKFDSVDSERDEAPISAPDRQWYDEWCDHVRASNEAFGEADHIISTVPVDAYSHETPVQEPNPALVHRSMSDQLKNAIGPAHDIKTLLLRINIDPDFEGIKSLSVWFKSCDIYVESFFTAIATYNSMRKQKDCELNKDELISLCSLVLKRLSSALLYQFGDDDYGNERSELAPFVLKNMGKYETQNRGEYYCEPIVLDTLRHISTYAKSQLNGTDVDKYYNDIVLTGLLPES